MTLPVRREWISSTRRDVIVSALRQGMLIAYPTEGVYGLGCLPDQLAAIERLLQLKQRSVNKGLLLIGSTLSEFAPWIAPLCEVQQAVIANHYAAVCRREARPTTWIVPAAPNASPLVRGAHDTIGIRLCPHPIVQAICQRAASPLVSTSANLSGRPTARNPHVLRRQFHDTVEIILSHPTLGYNRASQIISLDQQTLYRA